MLIGVLLVLTQVILLVRYLAKALPVSLVALAGLGLVAAWVTWQDSDESRYLQRQELHLSHAPERYPVDRPLAVELKNDSNRPLLELRRRTAAYHLGDSVNLVDTSFDNPCYRAPNALLGSDSWHGCLPLPPLRPGHRVSTLEFRTEYLDGRFGNWSREDSMETRRLFDQGPAAYASARLRYSDTFYRHLAGLCGQHRRAWDCATGTSQAALDLAQHLGEVLASDTSAQRIEYAVAHLGTRYSVQDAEAIDYPDTALDLICVVQAWYWFGHSRFNRESLRVLRPGDVFTAWGYGWFNINAQIDVAIDEECLRPIGPYWVQQNRLLWNAYRDVELSLGEFPTPAFVTGQQWSLARLFDYMATWSASRLCREAQGNAFARQVLQRVAALWGEPISARGVRMPLALRVARKNA